MIIIDEPNHLDVINQRDTMYPTTMICVKEDYLWGESINTVMVL